MIKITKPRIFEALINSASGIILVFVFLRLGMVLASFQVTATLAIVPMPFVIGGLLAIILPRISKFHKQPRAGLVTFFSVVAAFIAFELMALIATALKVYSAIFIPAPLDFAIFIALALPVVFLISAYFYKWKAATKIKVIILSVILPILYIAIPLTSLHLERIWLSLPF